MKSLIEIFNNHEDKPVTKWSHYLEIYERHLCKFVGKQIKILEIGVEYGGSLQLWKKYFGENCEIIGIDIDQKTKYEEDQIKVEIGSQSDIKFLNEINQKYGPFDIIIDDGSHMQIDILNSFYFLYPKLKNGGVYIVEDVHTAYFPGFGGGITSPLNFITIASRFTHDTNLEFMSEPYRSSLDDLKSISFYNSMIVFEKEKTKESYSITKGNDEEKNKLKLTSESLKSVCGF